MTMKPKIYDCFCYFNEDLLLELRLETLWDYVDYFVICESILTIAGHPKPLYFDTERFLKYKSKIRHLILLEYPFPTNDAWRNERWQRNYLSNGLFDAQDHDWIMISDVDEIPRPESIVHFIPSKYKRADFEQYMYAYFLNNRWEVQGEPVIWIGTKITTYQNFKSFFSYSMEYLRNYKSSGLLRGINRMLFNKLMVQKIVLGGWHFTWMAGIDKIIQKLESFAHQEFNKPEFKNPEKIRELIQSGKDVLFPERKYQAQVLDIQFPEYLFENNERFREYLLICKDEPM